MTMGMEQSLSRDEQLMADRLRSADTSDVVWRSGNRRNSWDVAVLRRAFGRSSDEFCRGQRGPKPAVDDIALIHGIRSNFGAAVRAAAVADQVAGGGSGLSAAGQMMLFGLDSLVRAETFYRIDGAVSPSNTALFGLLRWRHAQGTPWPEVISGAYREELPEPTGWLIGDSRMFEHIDRDEVCDAALAKFAERQAFGSFRRPINDARTPSAILRTIGLATWADDPEEVFAQAAANALLTHGHPDAYLSAGAFAVIIGTLLAGGDFGDAVEIVREELVKWPSPGNVGRALEAGRAAEPGRLAELAAPGAAPNALAVAVAVAQARFGDFEAAVGLANQLLPDSTALAGAMLAAAGGDAVVPAHWLDGLGLADVIDRLVDDVVASRVGLPGRTWQRTWAQDYPSF
ncbi:ADP-ribosylglycohydrolase [Saccharopolyspora shandongensis]|uniref:ADP-ribosylglycohydrolase n=1 Tax=Saccharopolyspora shandongensis TaxID=418495 RepID=A0A1H3C2N3_9PSEU|nr:ADP-ribosylglycohydrolase family protein [Saccharopolyspora shandongensis]SDX47884.1 ADP-ribosylglycohydrolase [Saccharopolyspora shandongensis]